MTKTITQELRDKAKQCPKVTQFLSIFGKTTYPEAAVLLADTAKMVNLKGSCPPNMLANVGAGLQFLLQENFVTFDDIKKHYAGNRKSMILLPEMPEDLYLPFVKEQDLVEKYVGEGINFLTGESHSNWKFKSVMETTLAAIAGMNPDKVLHALAAARSKREVACLLDLGWKLFRHAWDKEPENFEEMDRYLEWFLDKRQASQPVTFLFKLQDANMSWKQLGKILAFLNSRRAKFEKALERDILDRFAQMLCRVASNFDKPLGNIRQAEVESVLSDWSVLFKWASARTLDSVNIQEMVAEEILPKLTPNHAVGGKDFKILTVLKAAKMKNVVGLVVYADAMPDFLGGGAHFNFRNRTFYPEGRCPAWELWKKLDIKNIAERKHRWYMNGLLSGCGDFVKDIRARCRHARVPSPVCGEADAETLAKYSNYGRDACFTHVCPEIGIGFLKTVAKKGTAPKTVLDNLAEAVEKSFSGSDKIIETEVRKLSTGGVAFQTLPGAASVRENPLFRLLQTYGGIHKPLNKVQIETLMSGNNREVIGGLLLKSGIEPDIWQGEIPAHLLKDRTQIEAWSEIWLYLVDSQRLSEATKLSGFFWSACGQGGMDVIHAAVEADEEMVQGWILQDLPKAVELCANSVYKETARQMRALVLPFVEPGRRLEARDHRFSEFATLEDLEAALFLPTAWNKAVLCRNIIMQSFSKPDERRAKTFWKKHGEPLSREDEKELLQTCFKDETGWRALEALGACLGMNLPELWPELSGLEMQALCADQPDYCVKLLERLGAELDWRKASLVQTAKFWKNLPSSAPPKPLLALVEAVVGGMKNDGRNGDLQELCIRAVRDRRAWMLRIVLAACKKLSADTLDAVKKAFDPLPNAGWEHPTSSHAILDELKKGGYLAGK